jgi:hypothetical protein
MARMLDDFSRTADSFVDVGRVAKHSTRVNLWRVLVCTNRVQTENSCWIRKWLK